MSNLGLHSHALVHTNTHTNNIYICSKYYLFYIITIFEVGTIKMYFRYAFYNITVLGTMLYIGLCEKGVSHNSECKCQAFTV